MQHGVLIKSLKIGLRHCFLFKLAKTDAFILELEERLIKQCLDVKTIAANAAETKESVIASAMEVKAARIMIINNSRFVLCHCPFVIGYVV